MKTPWIVFMVCLVLICTVRDTRGQMFGGNWMKNLFTGLNRMAKDLELPRVQQDLAKTERHHIGTIGRKGTEGSADAEIIRDILHGSEKVRQPSGRTVNEFRYIRNPADSIFKPISRLKRN
ncbi:uncharacterized protein LOC124413312 [Diprion similis]|uniref:uncharacterized protein LOC124413312 n=1 Tax=Diprion similis TaxID=362088 RepID=UPI001EF88F33|nr:uncharacterized protein LOC124413312 [Diprion similis]